MAFFKAFRFQNFRGEHAPRPPYKVAPSAFAEGATVYGSCFKLSRFQLIRGSGNLGY